MNIFTAGFLPGMCSALSAILMERKSRRGTLAVYMLNQVFVYILWVFLKSLISCNPDTCSVSNELVGDLYLF